MVQHTYIDVHVLFDCISDDHGPLPATPTDDVTYAAYKAGVYRMNLNFTNAPAGVSYLVRLTTSAINLTSYFLIVPVCDICYYSCHKQEYSSFLVY